MGRVVAIDGPSGTGKSSVAKEVAARLGFDYLDTGALYRAVALRCVELDLDPATPESALSESLAGTEVFFCRGAIILNGTDISDRIRTPAADTASSVFSAIPAVRDFLFHIQKNAADLSDIVAEGRDMTTVVFPDAWKKFYLDADPEVRAMRRYLQAVESGVSITYEDVLRNVRERDDRDMNRAVAPLRRAADSRYIDTTRHSFEAVVAIILESVAA